MANASWYRRNREYALGYARERWRAAHPVRLELTCERCSSPFNMEIRRGSHKRLFCDACRIVRARERSRLYKTRHREELLAKDRRDSLERRMTDPEFAMREREKARKYREANPDKVKQSRRRSYLKHHDKRLAERRARQVRDRLAIYERDGGVCHICIRPVSRDDFEIDHIIPVSRGGTNDVANLATAHFRCNRRKAAKLLEELTA